MGASHGWIIISHSIPGGMGYSPTFSGNHSGGWHGEENLASQSELRRLESGMKNFTRSWGWFFIVTAVSLSKAEVQPKPEAGQKHCLWKVEGKTKPLYLLGSVHVLKSSDYPLDPVIETAYSNCSTIVFEADIGAMEEPGVAMKLMSKGMLPEGQTLASELSPEVYKAFTNYATEAGVPLLMIERFQPALAAMTIVVLEMQKLGLDPQEGVDKHFFSKMKDDSKQLVALETAEFQMSLLTDLTKEEGELVVKTTLKDIKKLKKELGDMIQAWKIGDTAKVEKFLNEATKEAPALYKKLLADRNERWMPKLEELLKGDKATFVVVGAGHLVGKDGVVELLRKKEWKVTQL
jgi:uncharacterized protein YbaP (TraB family)